MLAQILTLLIVMSLIKFRRCNISTGQSLEINFTNSFSTVDWVTVFPLACLADV